MMSLWREDVIAAWNTALTGTAGYDIYKRLRDDLGTQHIMYAKAGELRLSETPLNIAVLSPGAHQMISDDIIPALQLCVEDILPRLYRTTVARELSGRARGLLDKLADEPMTGRRYMCGADCVWDTTTQCLKVLEINMNAVVSLGYQERHIDSWRRLALPQAAVEAMAPTHFRHMLNDYWAPCINDKHLTLVLTDQRSGHRQEEETQVALLQSTTTARVLMATPSDLAIGSDGIVRLGTASELPTVNLIKRAISGSILASSPALLKQLLHIDRSTTVLINPIGGLLLGSKLGLHLLGRKDLERVIEGCTDVSNTARPQSIETLRRLIPTTHVLLEGYVHTTEGARISIEDFARSHSRKRLVLKDAFGGGFTTTVVFGRDTTQAGWERALKLASTDGWPWVIQTYIAASTGSYLLPRGNAMVPTQLRELIRLCFAETKGAYWGLVCTGPRARLSLADGVVQMAFSSD